MCPFLIGYNGRYIITHDKWTYITWPLHLVIELCRPTNGCSRHPIPLLTTMQLGRLGVYLELVACFLMPITCFIMRIWWEFQMDLCYYHHDDDSYAHQGLEICQTARHKICNGTLFVLVLLVFFSSLWATKTNKQKCY